jgi:hypothetical protein
MCVPSRVAMRSASRVLLCWKRPKSLSSRLLQSNSVATRPVRSARYERASRGDGPLKKWDGLSAPKRAIQCAVVTINILDFSGGAVLESSRPISAATVAARHFLARVSSPLTRVPMTHPTGVRPRIAGTRRPGRDSPRAIFREALAGGEAEGIRGPGGRPEGRAMDFEGRMSQGWRRFKFVGAAPTVWIRGAAGSRLECWLAEEARGPGWRLESLF